MALNHVQAVIVGAGAGGGVVAKELSTAGLRVVLLERGKWHSAADCRKDDLRNQRTAALGNGFGPEEEGNPRVLVDDRGEHIARPERPRIFNNNAACVGGGTFSYGAMAWRYMEQDFRMRTTYGAVEGSTLDDWPIAYRISSRTTRRPNGRWASRATTATTSSRRRGGSPSRCLRCRRTRSTRCSVRPRNGSGCILSISRCCGTPSRTTAGGACMRCRWCVGFACELNARTGTHNTVIPKALATGNCELRTGCMTKEILLDDSGRARGVAYFDAEGRLQEQTADLVIVSGGAVESARLLLNTRHRLFPNGLGNRYDWVGRNLQSHSYTGAVGLFDFDTYDDLGPGASIAICDYNHGNPGLAGGAMLANEFIRLPYQFMGLVPPWVAALGPGAQGVRPDGVQAHHRRDGARAGDAALRRARAGRPEGEGPLGHPGRAPLREAAPAYDGDRPLHRRQGRGVVEGSGRGEYVAADAGPGTERRPASGGHLPHGQRSEDLRRRPRLPDSRRGQRVRHRREHARDERRLQPGADDPGERLSRFRQPAQGVERVQGGFMKRILVTLAIVAAAVILMAPGASLYYERDSGRGCTSLPRDAGSLRSVADVEPPRAGVRGLPRRRIDGRRVLPLEQRTPRNGAPPRRTAREDPAGQPLSGEMTERCQGAIGRNSPPGKRDRTARAMRASFSIRNTIPRTC